MENWKKKGAGGAQVGMSLMMASEFVMWMMMISLYASEMLMVFST